MVLKNDRVSMKKHYYWLDLVRFIAAFEVFISHYRIAFFVEYGLLPAQQKNILTSAVYFFTRMGKESVLLFFVLSGFLVGGKSIEKILSNNVNLKSYSIDRLVRIMLPLFASVMLVILIDLITGAKIPLYDIVGSLLSLQGIFTTCYNNAPLWSLSYEVWFYVLMGCIMALCRIQSRKVVLFAFFIATMVLLVFTRLQAVYLFIWFMGAFTYLIPPPAKNISTLKTFLALVLFFAAVFLSQLGSDSRSVSFVNFPPVNKDILDIFLAFATCILIHHIIRFVPGNKYAVKLNNAGTKLSKFSYSLYLVHYPVISLLEYLGFSKSTSIDPRSVLLYILALLIGLLVAYIIYLLSEKHTHTVKKMFSDSRLFRLQSH